MKQRVKEIKIKKKIKQFLIIPVHLYTTAFAFVYIYIALTVHSLSKWDGKLIYFFKCAQFLHGAQFSRTTWGSIRIHPFYMLDSAISFVLQTTT